MVREMLSRLLHTMVTEAQGKIDSPSQGLSDPADIMSILWIYSMRL